MREYEILKRLGRSYDIRLVAVSKTHAEDLRNVDVLREACSTVDVFPAVPGPSDGAAPQIVRHMSADASAHVAAMLAGGTIDLVHAEGFYMLQHVPESTDVPVLLVEQNVEYELYRQRLGREVKIPRRQRLAATELTREAETAAWRRASVIGAVTEDDRATIANAVSDRPVVLFPDGADHLSGRASDVPAPGPVPESPSLLFVGNFAYEPNIDAAEHLVNRILPVVRRRMPDATLWLVGNDPGPRVRALASDRVVVTGRVPSVVPYLAAADVFVCPLRIGGGIKVKLLEAATQGKAIVTTSVGVQGFPDTNGAILVDDRASAFARTVIRLLERPAERDRLGTAAKALAATMPTWDEAADAVALWYDRLLGRPRRTTPALRARPDPHP